MNMEAFLKLISQPLSLDQPLSHMLPQNPGLLSETLVIAGGFAPVLIRLAAL